MTFLLDVNVLIALMDRFHVNHSRAVEWFDAEARLDWATCPVTENGVVRILGNAAYRNFPGSATVAAEMVREFAILPGHVFWPDDISLLDATRIDTSRLLTGAQVTDSYLLALSRAHGGKLATLDQRLISSAVIGGAESLFVIR